jgi:hypothetical protein
MMNFIYRPRPTFCCRPNIGTYGLSGIGTLNTADQVN